MIDAQKLKKLIAYSIDAHDKYAKKPYKTVRLWDKKTPYSIHPIWCATMLLHETELPQNIRVDGAQALLLHDVIEDTSRGLPRNCSPKVKKLVRELTFDNSEEAMIKIWQRSDIAKLLKLYDATSNLLDGSWMTTEKRLKRVVHLKRLSREVKKKFGNLNIIQFVQCLY